MWLFLGLRSQLTRAGCIAASLTNSNYNNIVVIMIPHLTSLPGAPWDVLPAGIHTATFSEVEVTFAINAVRRELFAGLLDAAISLRGVGCVKLYLDGSYVTG